MLSWIPGWAGLLCWLKASITLGVFATGGGGVGARGSAEREERNTEGQASSRPQPSHQGSLVRASFCLSLHGDFIRASVLLSLWVRKPDRRAVLLSLGLGLTCLYEPMRIFLCGEATQRPGEPAAGSCPWSRPPRRTGLTVGPPHSSRLPAGQSERPVKN